MPFGKLNIINFNDPHCTVKPPHSRRGDYMECIHDKFVEMAKLADQFDVNIMTCGGDIFHRKGNTTAHDITATIQVFKALKKYWPIYTIVGNHDSPEAWTAETKAIKTLGEAGVIHLVSREPVLINNIMICGVDYDRNNVANTKGVIPDLKLIEAAIAEFDEDVVGSLILSHANVWNSTKQFPGGGSTLTVKKLLAGLSHVWDYFPTMVCNGHLHMNQHRIKKEGILINADNVDVLLHGGIIRVARDEIVNVPNFSYIQFYEQFPPDIDAPVDAANSHFPIKMTGQIVPLVDSVRPDVFVDPDELVNEEENKAIVEFVKALNVEGGLLQGDDLKILIGELADGLEVSKVVRDRALTYVEG